MRDRRTFIFLTSYLRIFPDLNQRLFLQLLDYRCNLLLHAPGQDLSLAAGGRWKYLHDLRGGTLESAFVLVGADIPGVPTRHVKVFGLHLAFERGQSRFVDLLY